jgi:hypothetical protein
VSKKSRSRKRHRQGDDPLALQGQRSDLVQQLLLQTVDDARQTELPQLAMLLGETGRGKSYAIQTFYDRLSTQEPGYWQSGLTPSWPAESLASLRRERKLVTPPARLRRPGETMPFLWLAVGCSGYADAPRLDPAADLLRQLRDLLAEAAGEDLAAARRRRWIAGRLADGLGQLEPTLGALKFALETLAEMPQALGGRAMDNRLVERTQVYEALGAFAGVLRALRLAPIPLVVVIDDAAGASEDLLEVISSFVGEPTGPNGRQRFLPKALDQFPPLPIVFLISAWNHSLISEAQTPIARWLAEYEALDLRITNLDCREIHRDEATRLLDRWLLGPNEDTRSAIVDHASSCNANGLINPLVLAEHVAAIEEKRDPYSAALDVTPDFIASLSTSPEHHVQERLDALREQPGGPEALGLLTILAHVSITLPWGIVVALHEIQGGRTTLTDIRELFVEIGVATSEALIADLTPLRVFATDPDLFGYLQASSELTPDQQDVLAQASARFFCAWIESAEADRLLKEGSWGLWGRFSSLMLSRYAELGQSYLAPRDDTISLLSQALCGDLPDLGEEKSGPPAALSIAWLVCGHPDSPSTEALLAGCTDLGLSPAGLACLKALSERRDLTALGDTLDPLLRRLEAHADLHHVEVALVGILIRRNALDRALRLKPPGELTPQSALLIADALATAKRTREAADLIAPYISDQTMLLRQASFVADSEGVQAAIDVLRPYMNRWSTVQLTCALLARADRVSERATLLGRWAGNSPHAARILAADRAATGDADGARALLFPWKRGFLQVARQLARLEWSQGQYFSALAVLGPFFERSERAALASTLAPMLDEVGRLGLRFKVAGDIGLAVDSRSTEAPSLDGGAETALASEILTRLRDRSPSELAAELSQDGLHSGHEVERFTEALRAHLADPYGKLLAEVGYHLCRSCDERNPALAAATADMAIAARLGDAVEAARSALAPYADEDAPAIQGRLLALATISGLTEGPLAGLNRLSAADRPDAFAAVHELLEVDPDLEVEAWRAISEEVELFGDPELRHLTWVYATARLLPITRALSPEAFDDIGLLRRMLPSLPWRELIPLIEATLYSYVERPDRVEPRIPLHHVISMFESLRALGHFNPNLEGDLIEALAASPDAGSLGEWANLSTLADRAERRAMQPPPTQAFSAYPNSTSPIRFRPPRPPSGSAHPDHGTRTSAAPGPPSA